MTNAKNLVNFKHVIIESNRIVKVKNESIPENGYFEIPHGVSIIDFMAFDNCGRLKLVRIPETVLIIRDEAFANCVNLKLIKIPRSVKEIGHGVFANCTNLKLISVPGSVTTISSTAFGLTSVRIPSGVKTMDGSLV